MTPAMSPFSKRSTNCLVTAGTSPGFGGSVGSFLAAAVQLTSTPDPDANFAAAEEQIELAARRGAELVGLSKAAQALRQRGLISDESLTLLEDFLGAGKLMVTEA